MVKRYLVARLGVMLPSELFSQLSTQWCRVDGSVYDPAGKDISEQHSKVKVELN